MKKLSMILLTLAFLTIAVKASDQYLPGTDNRFQIAESKSGGGFYWVDTANGRTWKMDPVKKEWEYCGKPSTGKVGSIGAYIPYSNRNGRGVFILNTSDGQCWFYDGKKWSDIGKPVPRNEDQTTSRIGY